MLRLKDLHFEIVVDKDTGYKEIAIHFNTVELKAMDDGRLKNQFLSFPLATL